MIKKLLIVVVLILSMFCMINVEASSESKFIDVQTYTNIYKLSEDSDVKLPFVKLFNSKAIFDKKLDKSGLIIASNAIEITDSVNGMQTIISSDTVDIKGSIEYATIAASNVMISGTVEKDIFIFAESVFITETANILGDIVVMAETLEMKGSVQGNFVAGTTKFEMAGYVGKDFRVHSEEMTFEETNIKGDIYIETESDIKISEKYPNAVVNKTQTNVVTEAERKDQIIHIIIKTLTAVILFTLLNMLIRKIKPEVFKNLKNKGVKHSSFAVIMGVVLLITIPLIVILATLCSVFGLGVVTTPLFVVYLALVIVTIALAKFIVGSTIFEYIKERFKIDNSLKEIIILLSIFALLYIICYLPYIAWFSTMAIVLLSAGIVVTGLIKKQ